MRTRQHAMLATYRIFETTWRQCDACTPISEDATWKDIASDKTLHWAAIMIVLCPPDAQPSHRYVLFHGHFSWGSPIRAPCFRCICSDRGNKCPSAQAAWRSLVRLRVRAWSGQRWGERCPPRGGSTAEWTDGMLPHAHIAFAQPRPACIALRPPFHFAFDPILRCSLPYLVAGAVAVRQSVRGFAPSRSLVRVWAPPPPPISSVLAWVDHAETEWSVLHSDYLGRAAIFISSSWVEGN